MALEAFPHSRAENHLTGARSFPVLTCGKSLRDFQGAALESLTRSVMIFGIVKLLRNFEFHNTAIQDELRNFENLSPIFNFRNDEM